MAVELAPFGIRVNVVNPVAGETPLSEIFFREDTPEMRGKFLSTILLEDFLCRKILLLQPFSFVQIQQVYDYRSNLEVDEEEQYKQFQMTKLLMAPRIRLQISMVS